MIEDIALRDFTPEDPPYDSDDIKLMIRTLCAPSEVLYPEFLQKVSFPYRMLRLALNIYQTNPTPMSRLSEIRLSDDETDDPAITELILFQLLGGAKHNQIESNLIAYRQLRADASASRSQRDHTLPKLQEMDTKIHHPHAHHDLRTPPRRNVISDVRAYNDDPVRHHVAPATRQSNVDTAYHQSKKGYAVHSYFKNRQFTGAPEQSVDTLLRDYEICGQQQCLDPSQISLFFVNALADPARQFFLTQCSTSMPYDQIAAQMRRHYNSETRKLQNQSEMDSLNLTAFMNKHQITDLGEGLTKIVNHINALAPQLPTGFGDDAHKTRYLRRAVLGQPFAQQPISQITSARYSFTQLTTALKENLQLREELSRASSSS